jgi:hypothetical protein
VNIFTGESSDALFGGEVPKPVKALIDQARSAEIPEHAIALLWTAQVCAPDCLSVYYLLYKLHARLADFETAEQAALKGLRMAAEQANLPYNWLIVTAQMADFMSPGPARFWLFTLKALAFIRLRQKDPMLARAYLSKVAELDPQGGSGVGVIEDLLKGSMD